jgi:hypothetical protein
MAETLNQMQRRICETYGATPDPPAVGSKVGIALQTLDRAPLHGTRIAPSEGTSGWYIHAGNEWSEDPDFYQPLCIEHLEQYCKLALLFLCLPPGWRFLTDGEGYVDAWFDESVLRQLRG